MTSSAEQISALHRDLRAAIAKAGNCTALAKALGISRWTVYRWRDGEHLPSYELGARLRGFLAQGVSTPAPGAADAAQAILDAAQAKKGAR